MTDFSARGGSILLKIVPVVLVSVAVFRWVDWERPPALFLFFGGFHPQLVHFPIALLLLAALLELAGRLLPVRRGRDATVGLLLTVGLLGALAASGSGLFLTWQGGYEGELVDRHRWAGLTVTATAALAWVLRRRCRGAGAAAAVPRVAYRAVLVLLAISVLTAGHLGGTLTHGPGYLTRHLPEGLRFLPGLGGSTPTGGPIPDVDAAVVFDDLLRPVLDRSCVRCHTEGRSEGGLRLDSPEAILAGSGSGPILRPERPEQSEIYRRVTLPLYHGDLMPPRGETPLSVGETELIRWWIAEGASFEQTVSEASGVPPSVATLLNRLRTPRDEERRGIYALGLDPPDPERIEELRARGFVLRRLAVEDPFLELDLSFRERPVDGDTLEPLRPLFDRIASVNLAGARIRPEAMRTLAEMSHLTRLKLQNSDLRDSDLAFLSELRYLESLNLYGTGVTDRGLRHLEGLPSLRSLYLWRTGVTREGAKGLRARLPQTTIELGGGPLLEKAADE